MTIIIIIIIIIISLWRVQISYITSDFPDITTIKHGGLQVPTGRTGFVRKMIISYLVVL